LMVLSLNQWVTNYYVKYLKTTISRDNPFHLSSNEFYALPDIYLSDTIGLSRFILNSPDHRAIMKLDKISDFMTACRGWPAERT